MNNDDLKSEYIKYLVFLNYDTRFIVKKEEDVNHYNKIFHTKIY